LKGQKYSVLGKLASDIYIFCNGLYLGNLAKHEIRKLAFNPLLEVKEVAADGHSIKKLTSTAVGPQ
jgi:hypothetical protein